MHIRSDRQYRFAAGRAELWAAIHEVDEFQSFWPWLCEFDGTDLAADQQWSCVVRPPLPYRVRFTVRLDEVDAERLVTATIAGDIVGTARLELADAQDGCVAHLASSLAPDQRALQAMAVLARPLVRHGHNWVLDAGARQFAMAFASRPDLH